MKTNYFLAGALTPGYPPLIAWQPVSDVRSLQLARQMCRTTYCWVSPRFEKGCQVAAILQSFPGQISGFCCTWRRRLAPYYLVEFARIQFFFSSLSFHAAVHRSRPLVSVLFDVCLFHWLLILYSTHIFTSFNLYLLFFFFFFFFLVFQLFVFFFSWPRLPHTSFVFALAPRPLHFSPPPPLSPVPQPLSVYTLAGPYTGVLVPVCSCWSLIPELNGLWLFLARRGGRDV